LVSSEFDPFRAEFNDKQVWKGVILSRVSICFKCVLCYSTEIKIFSFLTL
jgi:hypothetical protein